MSNGGKGGRFVAIVVVFVEIAQGFSCFSRSLGILALLSLKISLTWTFLDRLDPRRQCNDL